MRVRMGARRPAAWAAIAALVFTVGASDLRLPDGADHSAGAERAAVDDSPSGVARRTGKKVEVKAERTEDSEVYANPDGTFTATLHLAPVRVRHGGRWVPIDTTLRTGDNGTVVPKAVSNPMTFSGGGTAPLVRLSDGDAVLTLTWPGGLPQPRLAGATATYHEVLPGVDLRLTATARGFTKVLVVKHREAAARVAELRYGIAVKGAKLRADRYGNLTATGRDGRQVFGFGAPLMWDSAKPAHRSVGAQRLDGGQLVVRPDRRLLTSPATKYPVFIDPNTEGARTGWAMVFSGYPTRSYWGGDGDGVAKVGQCYQGNPNYCNGIGAARSYFTFDVNGMRGKNVISAEFNAFENYAPSCGARWVEAWNTNTVNSSTTWNNQPHPSGSVHLSSAHVAYGYGTGDCAPNWVGFPATVAVTNALTYTNGSATIMLKAADDNDQLAWKKFHTDPNLKITYNSYPDAPGNLSSADDAASTKKACAIQPNHPAHNPPMIGGNNKQPVLYATASDPDGGLVAAQFEWYVRFGNRVGTKTTGMQGSGTLFTAAIPDNAFPDGARVAYRVRAYDGRDYGPWGSWCDFDLDRTSPTTAPGVSSAVYPENARGGGIGRTGNFTLDAKGNTDIVGFRYGLNVSNPTAYAAANQPGGTATIAVTPENDHAQDLYVVGVDRAGNPGPVYRSPTPDGTGFFNAYHFQVGAGSLPVGRWTLDGYGTATAAPDGSGHGHPGTLGGAASWGTGRHGDAVALNGSTGYVSTTGGPALRTDATFSVAAWVKLTSAPGGVWKTAVSQNGNRTSGFLLQYSGATKGWSFRIPRSDGDNVASDESLASGPAEVGVWTHLTGTYDAATGKLRLYVNGAEATPATRTTAWWHAPGGLQIGRAKWNGAMVDHFPGLIDEVRVYDRLLPSDEVKELAGKPTREELFLPLDEGTGTVAADATGNRRSGTLAGDVAWTAGPAGPGAVHFGGAQSSLKTAGPVVRTDGSFTVSAFVNPDVLPTVTKTVVSQDGTRNSGFYLQYRADTGGWVFMMLGSDTDNPVSYQAYAPAGAYAEEWTHLAGVYDAPNRELRLYVNGALVATASHGGKPWHATGSLVVGRGKYNGVLTDRWQGSIDDVHVYTGVRTGDQIDADRQNPPLHRHGFTDGVFAQYLGHSGERTVVTDGAVPAGYHFDKQLGLPAPDGPGTKLLYSCLINGTEQMVSQDPNCEGVQVLGPLARVYTAPPEGVPHLPLYRCVSSGSDHHLSNDPGCEGGTNEFLFGYVRAYSLLTRYLESEAPWDHASRTTAMPASYKPEFFMGYLATAEQPGTTKLLACRSGDDGFLSTDPACDGATVAGVAGWIWNAPVPGVVSTPVYRCRTAGWDRFDSHFPDCEGQTFETTLGYVITHF